MLRAGRNWGSKMKSTLIVVVLCIMSSLAHAKKFRNSYIEFELPPKWNCQADHTEWVCRNTIAPKDVKKQAVIILTAKEVGIEDTIPKYKAHLKTPKMIKGFKGKPVPSKVKHVKEMKIGGHTWMDGLHLGSEVPAYYTRYLATVKQRIAVLVTFSAHQRYYTKYIRDFMRAIMSLRVIASGALLQGSAGVGALGIGVGGLGLDTLDEDFPEEPGGSSGLGEKMLILALLSIGIGGYFILGRGKKKKKKDPFS